MSFIAAAAAALLIRYHTHADIDGDRFGPTIANVPIRQLRLGFLDPKPWHYREAIRFSSTTWLLPFCKALPNECFASVVT